MDEIDIANERAESWLADRIRNAARPLPAGESGECIECGEYSKRLINDTCARCRDVLERIGRNRL